MKSAQMARYRIELHYVALESPDLALSRIRNRVVLGGHDVPEGDARRWFARSRANLPAAIALADAVRLYDNTDHDRPHREVAVLAEAGWWTAEHLPIWAAAAIARGTTPAP
jgi:predicted ABC-type ATPase